MNALGGYGSGEELITAEPVGPSGMVAELTEALAGRGLVVMSAACLEELEDIADSAVIKARADEETVPFRVDDYE